MHPTTAPRIELTVESSRDRSRYTPLPRARRDPPGFGAVLGGIRRPAPGVMLRVHHLAAKPTSPCRWNHCSPTGGRLDCCFRGAAGALACRCRQAPAVPTIVSPAPVQLEVHLGRLRLANPILVASGTFGYAREMAGLVDLSRLGGILPKTITPTPSSTSAMAAGR